MERNIYKIGKELFITSDEEIKDCWVLNIHTNEVYFCKGWYGIQPITKKIILTTDQDLIKDGIQAIPDEFLQWFIKNPTCEFVKVKYDKDVFPYGVETSKGYGWYKIIIPKEEPFKHIPYTGKVWEPKQETLEDSVITKERLERAFLNAKKHLEKGTMARFRASGFLEGILFASNELEEGEDFVFKNIEYIEIGWFGGKTIKTRKQTYSEFIIEKFENFLNKLDEK